MGELTHTIVDWMASYKSADKMPISSIKVYFNPILEGDGIPSPSNKMPISGWDKINITHAGENILNPEYWAYNPVNKRYIIYTTGGSITWSNAYNASDYIPVSKYTTYTLHAGFNGQADSGIAFYDINKQYISGVEMRSITQTSYTFTTPDKTAFMRFCNFQDIVPHEDVALFVGASVPSQYGAYTGQTYSTTFGATGKNLFNPDHFSTRTGYYTVNGDTITVKGHDGSGYGTMPYFTLPAGTYTFSRTNPAGQFRYSLDDKTETVIMANGTSSRTVTFDQDVRMKLKIGMNASSYPLDTKIMIEAGSSASATFEPYTDISYGGYIEPVRGEMVNFTKKIKMSDLQWEQTSGNFTCSLPNDHVYGRSIFACDIYNTTHSGLASMQDGEIKAPTSSSSTIYVKDTSAETLEDFLEKIEDGNIVYEIAPIAHTIPATKINSYLGVNNVFSDSNSYLECTYAFEDHFAKKRFFTRVPSIASASSGNIVSFNTDMTGKLKSCRIEFEPIQAGTGDPGPENIRAVNGWNGINVWGTKKNMIDTAASVTYRAGYNEHFWGIKNWSTKNTPDGSLVLRPGTYTFSIVNAEHNPAEWRVKDKSGNFIDHAYSGYAYRTFVIQETQPILLYVNSQEVGNGTADVQLEYGSQTAYEPYRGNKYSIDWQDEFGTILGGYIDLSTGEIWQDWVTTKVGTIIWNNWGSGGLMYATLNYNTSVSPSGRVAGTTLYADGMVADGTGDPQRKDVDILGYYGTNVNYPHHLFIQTNIAGSTIDDRDRRRAYINDNFGNVNIVFKTPTPIYVGSVSPTSIRAFKGSNNIWSDANGDITVEYWKQ